MTWSHLLNITQKELIDTIRDKRATRQALLVPIVLGLMYALINPLLSSVFESRAEETITIPVQGINYADDTLIAIFDRFGITLEEYDGDDMEADIAAGDESAGLIIPPAFSDTVANEELTIIAIRTNSTAGGPMSGNLSISRLELALNAYNQTITTQRLEERQIDTSVINPVTFDVADLSSPAQRAGATAALFIPILIAVTAVQGGMFIAIDVTAGEKERGTLEALLVTPSSDTEILLGKLAAVFLVTLIPSALTLLSYWFATNILPDSMTNGAHLPFTIILTAILVTLPMILFANILVMIISIRTKAFKDAQSALTPAMFGIMFVAMAAAFVPPTNSALYFIPVYGTSALVSTLAVGNGIPLDLTLYSIIGTLVAVTILFVVALQLFNRERLLYS
ncbi:MAG TPA: ABC transporter permease [Anaerolineae bacterium]|nr:ABC transporter permease [Anaerolineae bacterium]